MNIDLQESKNEESKLSEQNQRPLQWLRDATAEWHQGLDSLTAVKQLLAAKVTKQDYQPFIVGAYKAYAKLDVQLTQAFTKQTNVNAYVPRLPAISHDIQALGLQHEFKPYVTPSKTLAPLEALGARYVIDGSCHGARMILPHLQRCFAPKENTANLEYWRLLLSLNQHWPKLVQHIEQTATTADAKQRIIHSARDTFTVFIDALS